MNIGKNIKYLRQQQSMTQEQVAEHLGVTYQAVSKWENNTNTPDIALLPQIASLFGVSIDALFADEILCRDAMAELLPLIKDAYERGVIIAGLSAGAICWFSDIYTDSTAALGEGDKYAMFKGLNWLEGKISPHYGARMLDFDKIVCYNFDCAYGIEDDAALVIENGEIVGSVSSGGKAWKITQENGALVKTEIASI